jgi:hypothetical protein
MLAVSCTKEPASSDSKGESKAEGESKSEGDSKAEGIATAPGETKVGEATGKEPRPTLELLPEPRERRLHPDRATASSFLWNDWNRFQENYHPLYLVDDDPKTAWVEGAAGHGDGEWIRVFTTKIEAVTKVRLRLRNGYHKSKSLFEKNGRAKNIEVMLLPSKTVKSFELADSMEWAELVVEQPDGVLDAINLSVKTTYPGSKYKDLCLSDLEVYATSRNIENPEFEKSKLAKVTSWKKERVDTAKYFASKEAKSSPLLAGYSVEEGDESLSNLKSANGTSAKAVQVIELAKKHIKGHDQELDRALATFKTDFAGWTNVTVTPKIGKRVPAVDGLYTAQAYDLYEGSISLDGFAVPLPGKLAFFKTSLLAAFDSAKPVSLDDASESKSCRVKDDANYFYYQPPSTAQGRKAITDLLVFACGRVAERDAYYGFTLVQLLQYNDSGQLIALYDKSSVTTFQWSEGDDPKVVGGERLRASGSYQHPARLVPRTK